MQTSMPRPRAPTASCVPPRPPAAPELKFTASPLQAIAGDGTFAGYASLFDRPDLGHDVVAPGAFARTLKARGAGGIRLLYQHDPAQPIGVWERIHEDARGLYVRGRLTLEVAKAREVRALIKAGAIDGLSIGFKALKGARDPRSGLRRLTEIDLLEISVVTFPMLPGARIDQIKHRPNAGRTPGEHEFERWLTNDAGFSRPEARALMRSGFPGLKALKSSAPTQQWQRRLIGQMAEAARLLRQSAPR
jgi:uncharacterized protein